MKISVYITSYNQREYLAQAIESVLNQTLRPHEIIIVDDNSSDGSQGLISDYAYQYPFLIIPVFHSTNQGVAKARHSALKRICGDYVTYLDGDDLFLPDKLEYELNAIHAGNGSQLFFSNYYIIDEKGDRIGLWAESKKPPQGKIFVQTFTRDFPKGNLYRNEVIHYQQFKKIGFYDSKLNLYEDYDMRIRLTKRVKGTYIDKPLSCYRVSKSGLSSANAFEKYRSLKYIIEKNNHLTEDLDLKDQLYVKRKTSKMLWKNAEWAAGEVMYCDRGVPFKQKIKASAIYLSAYRYKEKKYILKKLMKLFSFRNG